jgi:hypothetical protein
MVAGVLGLVVMARTPIIIAAFIVAPEVDWHPDCKP